MLFRSSGAPIPLPRPPSRVSGRGALIGVDGPELGKPGMADDDDTLPLPRTLIPRSLGRSKVFGLSVCPACCRVLLMPASCLMGPRTRSTGGKEGPVGTFDEAEVGVAGPVCWPLGPDGVLELNGDGSCRTFPVCCDD